MTDSAAHKTEAGRIRRERWPYLAQAEKLQQPVRIKISRATERDLRTEVRRLYGLRKSTEAHYDHLLWAIGELLNEPCPCEPEFRKRLG
jgi:hypothetical protein